jgi:hypothetical protein
MDTYDDDITNVDKNSLIKYLCQRDLLKNYFPRDQTEINFSLAGTFFFEGKKYPDQIIKYLKDLNYYNVDTSKEVKKYLINALAKVISDELTYDFYSSMNDQKVGELLEKIKSSDEYKNFITQLNKNIERGFILSKFISDCNNILNFYNALTLEELNKLNY